MLIFNFLLSPAWALVNWSTLESSTFETVKKQYLITLFTEENCSVCKTYLQEVITCPGFPLSKMAVVAAGDNTYLRALRKELPEDVTLLKTTPKKMSQITRLTPTSFINEKKLDGFQNCKTITQEARRE